MDIETELAEIECRYENHIDGILKAHAVELDRLRAENEALRKRVAELQEDILVEEIETLRERVAELEALVREQNDKWADDVLRVETAEKRVEALQAELRHMYTFDNQHREKIAELMAQLRREKI